MYTILVFNINYKPITLTYDKVKDAVDFVDTWVNRSFGAKGYVYCLGKEVYVKC